MHLPSYLRTAAAIAGLYDGSVPFAVWLKSYFNQQKKFGSTDRKRIADLCFCFFRLGNAFATQTAEEQLLIGQLLCREESAFIRDVKPEWRDAFSRPVKEKLGFIQNKATGSFFPFLEETGDEIEKEAFNFSHLVQPDLFLRIRPGKKDIVLKKLQRAALPFSVEGDCVRLPNATKTDDVLRLDEEAVVQDKNSQRVLTLLKAESRNFEAEPFSAWDCCAASGGKSILLHDRFPNVRLTASDVRESILHNLKNRFRRAGLSVYRSFVADVSSAGGHRYGKHDLVICDAPCSGSGTWGRTPERLRFFQKETIDHYASLQKNIAVNAAGALKSGGLFLYITCSVFKKENEAVADHIRKQTDLRLVEQRYFKGYNDKADTLFAASFRS